MTLKRFKNGCSPLAALIMTQMPWSSLSFFQQYTLVSMVIASLILQFVSTIAFTKSTVDDNKPCNRRAAPKNSTDRDSATTSAYCEDLHPFVLDRRNPNVNKMAYICVLLIFILNFIIQLLDQIWMPWTKTCKTRGGHTTVWQET